MQNKNDENISPISNNYESFSPDLPSDISFEVLKL